MASKVFITTPADATININTGEVITEQGSMYIEIHPKEQYLVTFSELVVKYTDVSSILVMTASGDDVPVRFTDVTCLKLINI